MREFGERMHAKDGEHCLTEHYVLREVFRTEVCEGFDHVAVAKVLDKRGHLVTEKGGRPDRAERLPGMGSTRCYRIKPTIFNDDGD
jgi:putative DNA primase/helicase